MTDMFNEIVLTPEESMVINALRIVESSIERIASLSQGYSRSSTGERRGFVALLKENKNVFPLVVWEMEYGGCWALP